METKYELKAGSGWLHRLVICARVFLAMALAIMIYGWWTKYHGPAHLTGFIGVMIAAPMLMVSSALYARAHR